LKGLETGGSLTNAMETQSNANHALDGVRRALGAHRDQLLALVRRRSGGRLDAKEVLQIALQRALERADQVRDPARADAWVGRVVRNVVVDELRRKRAPVLPVDELELAAIDEDRGAVDCWCVLVQAEQLKAEHSQILRRVIVDGVAATEVAAELGITPNNAMVRLHRARAALRERLKAHCGTRPLLLRLRLRGTRLLSAALATVSGTEGRSRQNLPPSRRPLTHRAPSS